MGKNLKTIVFFVYSVFGLFFLNSFFEIITIPELVLDYVSWVYLLAGILLIFGGVFYLQAGRKKKD